MRTLGSAYRHGIPHADIQHALQHGLVTVEQADETWMILGPDRAGRLLEIGVAYFDDEEAAVVIHAMPMRRKYEQYVPKG